MATVAPLNAQDDHDVYVAGLCLTLVVASAIPAAATGVLWLSLLLLAVVWSQVLSTGAWINQPTPTLAPGLGGVMLTTFPLPTIQT